MVEALNLYAPCPLNMADSYGLVSAMLARHLTRLGVHCNVHAFGGTLHESQPADIAAIVRQPYKLAPGGIFIGYPTNYHHHSQIFEGPRIAITMFESSLIPRDWVPVLNRADAVIVPSQFCAEAFGESGVSAPIHVVPLGIGEVYRHAERPSFTPHDRRVASDDRPLTFLAFRDRGLRKGGDAAIQAFLIAFGDDTRVKLVIKTRKPRRYVQFVNPNIEMIQRDMSEEELYQLYLSCDALINMNKGEGFGLIPREFAATGGIALTTNWGGTADDLEQWGWSLPYTLEKADWPGHPVFEGQELGDWAALDPGEVAEVLRHVADHRAEYQQQAREKAVFAAGYTWEKFAAQVLNIWKEVARDGARSRRVHAA